MAQILRLGGVARTGSGSHQELLEARKSCNTVHGIWCSDLNCAPASRRRFHPLIKTLQSHCTLFCSELIVNHTSTSYIIHVTYARLFSLFVLPAHDNAAGRRHPPTQHAFYRPAVAATSSCDALCRGARLCVERDHAHSAKRPVRLCKEKPADPRTWLAQRLLANKPTLNLQAEGAAAA